MAEQQKPADQKQAQQQIQQQEEQKPSTQTYQPQPITISNCSHHCVHPNCTYCNPVKKPVAKKFVSKKAAAVLTSAEIDRMIDLGLGRGIDSTDPKPWINKTAFQVRRVTAESALGTEEGGSLQSYEREVTSIISHQTDLKSSVVVPQAPVQIGIDAEQSRSVSSTRRAVGKKVINRTISFRSDFSDVPYISYDHAVDYYNSPNATEGDESVADVQSDYYTFEERLSKWIVKRILQRQELTAHESTNTLTAPEPKFVVNKSIGPTDPLSVMSRFIYICNEDEKKKIIHDCYDFVKQFRVTHYVCSIELGATEYRVFSETDYTSKIGAGGSLAIEKLANLSVSHTTSSRKLKRASDVRTIGKITTDGRVGRGTHDEAVVGIRVEPIHTLVKLNYLQLALRRALMHYMEEQGDSSSGPFVVAFGPDSSLQYWTVNDDYTVHATRNPENASLFFILPSDNGKHPNEFHITYMGDDRRLLKKRVSSLTPVSQRPIQAIPRYLNASVSVFGTNPGPLQLRYHVSSSSQLLLFGRVANEKGPVSPQRWLQGHDMFFINCARRRCKRDGYIAMRQRRRHGQTEWITSCLPRCEDHNGFSIFMLFRLLPASVRDHTDKLDDTGEKIFEDLDSAESVDEQLARLGRGTVPVKFRVPPSPVPKRKPSLGGDNVGAGPTASGGDRLTVPESTFDFALEDFVTEDTTPL